jgi:hypothetical protein
MTQGQFPNGQKEKKNQKKFIFISTKLLFFHDALSYFHMRSEIIQIVSCNNYDHFHELSFIFWQKFQGEETALSLVQACQR